MNNSKLILGTVQMGLAYGIGNTEGQIRREEAYLILKNAYESGIKILDSAEVYGNAHEIIGSFHHQHPEKRFKVITKFPHEVEGKTDEKIEGYLHALNITKLEAIMFHSFDSYKARKESLDELSNFKRAGIIGKIGVSVYTNTELEVVVNDPLIDLIQLPFNLLDNALLRGELLKKAKVKGKTIHTRSAFLQGLFFMRPDSDKPIIRALENELLTLRKISADQKIAMHVLALAYCIHQPFIDNVLIGVDSTMQLLENIKAESHSLTDEILEKVNAISVRDVNLLNPSLWNKL